MPRNPDRTDLCHFTYADGRRCTLPQFPDDHGLCFHHREKQIASLQSREAGRQVSRFLETDILTACDVSCTLSALFGATAQGYIKPKTAATLAYIAQLMLQAQQLAKTEFLQAGGQRWDRVVRQAPAFNPVDPDFESSLAPQPSHEPQHDNDDPPDHWTEPADTAHSVNDQEQTEPVPVEEALANTDPRFPVH
jgi:hypothetical protein